MKIAFLSFYNGQVNRGVETVVNELAKRLSEMNDVTVLQSASNSFDTKYKVKVYTTKINWKIKDKATSLRRRLFIDYWSIKIALFTLRTIPEILKERFDVVIPFNGGWQVALIRITTWLYGGKMVISGQTGMGWDEKNNLWSLPNTFVALSQTAKEWSKKVNPLVKSIQISNGVDINKFKPYGEKFETKLKKPTVLAVGAFTEQKRMDLAIKAVAKLKDVSLLLVGGGGDLKEKLAEEGNKLLGDRFEITSVPYSEMPKVYRAADIFTLPSRPSEAFGNVLVEAMASGLPVIATNDPIRLEIVGNGGILVDPVNTVEYAKALQKALGEDWDGNPRKQAENFSWELVTRKYEELFKDLIKKE
jgi:glycosyltransferase involved in cell wall biosynthesis